MAEKIKNFRDLNIWKLGIEIVEDTYKLTKLFPKDELYGLTAQMRRSAVSIPSNVAEGFTRKHNQEYKQFLYISLGSCSELETQAEIACKLRYLKEAEKENILEKINHAARMTMSLIKCL